MLKTLGNRNDSAFKFAKIGNDCLTLIPKDNGTRMARIRRIYTDKKRQPLPANCASSELNEVAKWNAADESLKRMLFRKGREMS